MSRANPYFKAAELKDIVSIAMLETLGPISLKKIYHHFPSWRHFLKASQELLIKSGLTEIQARSIINRPQNIESSLRLLKNMAIGLITIHDPKYPQLLKEINDPPLWLFYRVDIKILSRSTLTVIGTRKPSAYAISELELLLPEQLVKKVTLVSGLAYGIDKKVHQLSLRHKSPTAAVLAGGLDSIYPSDHHRLAESIVDEGGVLLTEYPPLSRPRPAKFPIRNRIIAGLSPITVVVEAMIKSGSLTTAKAALDYNREVYAVPSDINRRSSGGTNFLIKKGAMLLDSQQQLIDYLGLKTIREKVAPVDKTEEKLIHLLESQSLTVDQLSALTKIEIPEILGILTHLELSGTVYQNQPGYYKTK